METGGVSAIDWAYLGSNGGEGIEDFTAACLRQRYPDALQTRPAQGDGGIDVYRDTPQGLVVWQIKKFTTPLTNSQKQQVKKSWKRFWETHVAPGKKTIALYHLATPWTPTNAALGFLAGLTSTAGSSRGPVGCAMQHDAPFVVVLVTEPTGDAFDLLDDPVVALGPSVRPSCRLRLNPLIYRR